MSVLDTKIIVDDNAIFRHPAIAENREMIEKEMGLERTLDKSAIKCGIHYHDLHEDGNIGLMINGAGMAMATMDSFYDLNAKPANFMDLSGKVDAQSIY